MKYALCNEDSKVWEADEFHALPSSELARKRRNLICTECNSFAWFNKESSNGRAAFFSAHHEDNCDLKVEWVHADGELADATEEENTIDAGEDIIVRLDEEKGGDIDVTPVERPAEGASEGGRSFVKKGARRESSQQFTLRRILHRLRKSPDFRKSSKKITFLSNKDEVLISGAVKDIVTHFDDINVPEESDTETQFYWGPVASVGQTNEGRIWLNSSLAKQDVSVAIFEDIADEFKDRFNVEDLEEDLVGSYVLVAGKCWKAGSGKPIIWCGTPNYIFVRRYNQ